MKINVGDKVQTGVYVLGQWRPMYDGIVIDRVNDELVKVDVGSLHGCQPWIKLEQDSHLRLTK